MLDIRKMVLVSRLALTVNQSPKRAPAQLIASQEETDSVKHQDKAPVNDETYWDKVRSAEVLPVWLSAVGTILAVVAAGFTLRAIYDQAKSGQLAAEAALLNAKALINSERPWLMIRIDKKPAPRGNHDQEVFKLSVFNYGKSPARVTSLRTRINFYVSSENELPLPPDYGVDTIRQHFLAPDRESSVFETVDPSSDAANLSRHLAAGIKGVLTKDMVMVVCGLVIYGDGVSANKYQTAFCYRHQRKTFESEALLVVCGPKEYNGYT